MAWWTRNARDLILGLLLAMPATAVVGCSDDAEEGGGVPTEPPARCVAPARPVIDADVVLVRAFERVSIDGPVTLTHEPAVDRWYVGSKGGTILTFENRDDAEPSTFADLSGRIAEAAEAGLLDIEFHPRFADNGYVFLYYTAPGGSAFLSRISRFESPDGGKTLDLDSETIVLEVDQPYVNHNGGDIGFGPDGYLYIGLGDGGAGGDPQGHGQNVDTLLGAMLRIDVDVAEGGYAIPADNPFAQGGGRGEIYAWGFRNPYRWNFDRQTGDLWLGDVGQHVWEEVDLVVSGGNYGWRTREGTDCLDDDVCTEDNLIPPVAQYRNTGTASVVAGFAYRGQAIPAIVGTFVYHDFYFGTMWGVTAAGGEPRVLGEGARGIAAWAEDATGELYGVNYYDGLVYRLEAAPEPGPDRFPRALSLTGCVDMLDPTRPAEGAEAYDVNAPFWSDGADKRRFIAVPQGGTVDVAADGDLEFGPGTVLVKSFFEAGRPVETRLLVHHEGDDAGWAGYGYAWNAEGTEATYVEQTRVEPVGQGSWVFPSSRECQACHTRAAGRSLGLEVSQLRREGGRGLLDVWAEIGWVEPGLAAEPLVPLDSDAPLDARVRSYLHVNCSPCHREEGTGGRASLDLRMSTPLADTGLCDRNPRAGDLELPDARVVAPGEPERSVLLARLRAEGSARMPPMGSLVADDEAIEAVTEWIRTLGPCP